MKYRENRRIYCFTIQDKSKNSLSSEKSESLTKKSSTKGSWCASTSLRRLCTGLHQIQNQGSFLQLILEPIWSQIGSTSDLLYNWNCCIGFITVL